MKCPVGAMLLAVLALSLTSCDYVRLLRPSVLKQLNAEVVRLVNTLPSSLLTTAGDLVFAGEANGNFNAFHARTGELLWQFNTGSGIHSNPVSYSVRGKQYVAVPTGWGGWVEGYAPEMYGAPRGNALVVFALS